MANPSKSEYIRWVKGSLNRLLPRCSLADDGTALLDYRSWLITFQMKNKLAVNAQVDLATQNALIKQNRKHAGYVRWIQNALLISGEGIKIDGKPIVADGSWGPKTEQAVKLFQNKHENTKADGWVGAKTERLLMLRTATVPPGRTKALRDPKLDPVVPAWDVPVPDDPIPVLTGESFRFVTSMGLDLSLDVFTTTSGTIVLEEMSKRAVLPLEYVAMSVGKSILPGSIDLSTSAMDCVGGIYPNLIHGEEKLTLNDITGWCLIYQGQIVNIDGKYLTVMFLSMGWGMVSSFYLSLLTGGRGIVALPALMLKSCRAIVAFGGLNIGSLQGGGSGGIGYLGLGSVEAKMEQLKSLVGGDKAA